MKVYAKTKDIEDICSEMNARGMSVHKCDYEYGEGCYHFIGEWDAHYIDVYYNSNDGRFWIYDSCTGIMIATELGGIFYNEEWFKNLISIFYI